MTPRTERNLGLGALLGAAGGVLLFASTFVDWYGEGPEAVTAWTSFELVDVLLALLALTAVYAAIAAIADPERLPAAPRAALMAAGPAALILVLVSIFNRPPVLQFSDTELELGVWLALVGSLLMTAGAILSRYRVSVVLGERHDRTRATRNSEPPADPAAETRSMQQTPPPPGR